MNRDLLIRIAEQIEAHPDHFDMSDFQAGGTDLTGGCGTTACIGGWAVWLDAPDVYANRATDHASAARDLLGLSDIQAGQLFFPNEETFWGGVLGPDMEWEDITPTVAASTLRDLAAGKVAL